MIDTPPPFTALSLTQRQFITAAHTIAYHNETAPPPQPVSSAVLGEEELKKEQPVMIVFWVYNERTAPPPNTAKHEANVQFVTVSA